MQALIDVRTRQPRVANLLDRLGQSPPQSLVLEGGGAEQRRAMALAWASRLNCESSTDEPCLDCRACRAIADNAFRDLVLLDGSQEAVKIDDVRALKSLIGEPPRGDGMRVAALVEAQGLTTEAANCLLKAMEEPRPGNVFVLTAPLRERLLPTLVSRSMVLTLSWGTEGQPDDAHDMAADLAGFWSTGRGWFERDGRGKLEPAFAASVLAGVERQLTQAYGGQGAAANIAPDGLDRLAATLDEARQALNLRVSPGLVLDWLAAAGRGVV